MECPRCEKIYTGYSALSRRDNETELCPDCGMEEAVVDFCLNEREIPDYWRREIMFLRQLLDEAKK